MLLTIHGKMIEFSFCMKSSEELLSMADVCHA